jgi:hypothetical protein
MPAATGVAHPAAMQKVESDLQPLDLAALVPPPAILYSLGAIQLLKSVHTQKPGLWVNE